MNNATCRRCGGLALANKRGVCGLCAGRLHADLAAPDVGRDVRQRAERFWRWVGALFGACAAVVCLLMLVPTHSAGAAALFGLGMVGTFALIYVLLTVTGVHCVFRWDKAGGGGVVRGLLTLVLIPAVIAGALALTVAAFAALVALKASWGGGGGWS